MLVTIATAFDSAQVVMIRRVKKYPSFPFSRFRSRARPLSKEWHCRHSPLWKLTQYVTGETWKMAKSSKILDDFAFKIIAQREKEGLGNVSRDDKKDIEDLLSMYMALCKGDVTSSAAAQGLGFVASGAHRVPILTLSVQLPI